MCIYLSEIHPNRQVIGGLYQEGIVTSGDCVRSCIQHNGCCGVDFNNDHPSCWFHFYKTACKAVTFHSTCTHYTLIACCK